MNEEIIGLVPAAGKGMRLGLPYPKELYPVIRDNHYKPIAQFVLRSLVQANVNHVVFVINETKHQLVGYFGNGRRFGCDISYVVQEPRNANEYSTSPGLAHALDSAYHLVRQKTVFFGMADTIMQPSDVFTLIYNAANPDDDVILGLFPTQHPEKFGMVRLDETQMVIEIVDKPKTTDLKAMWGCIIWRPRFTEYLHHCVGQNQVTDFAQIMNNARMEGLRYRGVQMINGNYIDLGTYEEIMELDRNIREE
jgi:glucose-1-phosphate thymidylyltransferase